jgi:hypothetical protein
MNSMMPQNQHKMPISNSNVERDVHAGRKVPEISVGAISKRRSRWQDVPDSADPEASSDIWIASGVATLLPILLSDMPVPQLISKDILFSVRREIIRA